MLSGAAVHLMHNTSLFKDVAVIYSKIADTNTKSIISIVLVGRPPMNTEVLLISPIELLVLNIQSLLGVTTLFVTKYTIVPHYRNNITKYSAGILPVEGHLRTVRCNLRHFI